MDVRRTQLVDGLGSGEFDLAGVGVGPGDPGLVSFRAAAVLESADLVLAPAARAGEGSIAAGIVSALGLRIKDYRELVFPMERNSGVLEDAWTRAAEPVISALDEGKNLAFITLGDPSLYSTWLYLCRAVLARRPGTRTAIVPGIMAVNAAAALLKRPLTEGEEGLAILPLPDPVEALDPLLPLVERLAIYKVGRRLPELVTWVEARGLMAGAGLACGIGLEGRERYGSLAELARIDGGYLSLAIVDTGKQGAKLWKREGACA